MGLLTSVFLTCPPDNWQIWQAPCLAFPLDMEETHRSHPWSDPARKNTKLSCFLLFCLHPRKLTWNLKMKVWKMIFLFKQVIFRFHVNFQGCNVFFSGDFSIFWHWKSPCNPPILGNMKYCLPSPTIPSNSKRGKRHVDNLKDSRNIRAYPLGKP